MIAFNDIVLLASELMVVVFGSILVFVSWRAYRREKSKSMLAMSIGFAVIVIGPLVEEFLLDFLGSPLIEAHTLRNLMVATSLLILVYSIYGVRD